MCDRAGTSPASPSPPRPGSRRNDVDWLRIGATFLLFPFHSARACDGGAWHVKSPERSEVFDVFVWLIHQFHMPLFFVLAGWSLERALATRTPGAVRRERYRRLLLPFLAGVALLSPPQAYVEAITQRGFTGSIGEFLGCFWTSLRCFSWHHLWFLLYLLVFTLLYLPLLVRLERRTFTLGEPSPRDVFLAIIPFAGVEVALRWRWPGYQNLYDDWANFAFYSLFFVAGFLLGKLPAFEAMVHRERRRWAIGFGLTIVAMLPLLALHRAGPLTGAAYVLYSVLRAVAGVLGVAAILGYGTALANVGSRWFVYLREAALPLYILHQAVIVVLGYWVVTWALPIGMRWLALLVASLAMTMAVFHLVVRPVRPLRIAFGMRAD